MSTLIERMTPAVSEGARRATVDRAGVSGRAAKAVPEPEVCEQAKRRRFSAKYKLRILREVDACKGDGDVSALLLREGLYSSLQPEASCSAEPSVFLLHHKNAAAECPTAGEEYVAVLKPVVRESARGRSELRRLSRPDAVR